MNFLELIKRHWFLAGTMVAILFAEIFPELGAKEGPLNPEVTVKYGAVSLIFLVSGLSIKLKELLVAVTNVRLHIFIQFFSQVFTPIFVKILTVFLWLIGVNEWILKGLITVGCMPPPVSSAVILTRAVGGNEAAAIFNSVMGCVIGVILTPFTLLFFWRNLIWRSGLAEGYTMRHCTVSLDLTSMSGFTIVFVLLCFICTAIATGSVHICFEDSSLQEYDISVDWYIGTNVSEEIASYIFRVLIFQKTGICITTVLRTTTLVPVFSTIFQLAVTVVAPLAVGQLICFFTNFEASSYPIGILGQIALLFIIFITFCQAFLNQDMQMNAHDILTTVLLVVLIIVFLTWLVFWISSKMTRSFCPEDVIAIIFCCTHKSLTLGIPMLRILYGGYAHMSTISLPLLVYHPTQIIMGGLLVAHLQDWMISRKRSRTRLQA